jgi:hypothetical protein
MAGQDQGKVDLSFKAAADLSTHQYKFMKLTADDTVGISAATTDNTVGVLQNKPDAAGKAATVRIQGKAKVVSGASITAGQEVSTNASGTAKVAVTTERVLGTCTKGGASGDLLEIVLSVAGGRIP